MTILDYILTPQGEMQGEVKVTYQGVGRGSEMTVFTSPQKGTV